MKLFIGHISALEYWRRANAPGSRISRAVPRRGVAPRRRELDAFDLALAGLGFDFSNLHINVAGPSARRKVKGVTCHSAGLGLVPESYCEIRDGLFVATPEAALCQAAQDLSLLHLLCEAYSLCGTYSNGAHEAELLPRMKAVSLQRYRLRCEGFNGSRKVDHVLKYLLDGSASKMETKLTLLLCLPQRYGGYGLPFPVLNRPIEEAMKAKAPSGLRGSGGLRCDLLWPEAGFALEYDSDAWHGWAEKLNADSKRRSKLEREGLHVLSVTRTQLRDVFAFDDVARITASAVGHRIRERSADPISRRMELRRGLPF